MNAQAYANGLPSTAYLEWGTNTSYGNITPTNVLAANYVAQNVAASITNLTPFTTYHFQEVVVNAAGTNYGSDLTFVTPPLVSPGQPTSLYQEDFGAVAGAGSGLTLAQVGWSQVLATGGSAADLSAGRLGGCQYRPVIATLGGLFLRELGKGYFLYHERRRRRNFRRFSLYQH